ncbi:ATP-binding protein [Halioglobus sp.]|nr:ATP-binding protein [Halioglobus sp.]
MSEAQIATSLGIVLLVALSTHIFYRRPPAALWPALPLVFFSALVFSVGDLLASIHHGYASLHWVGMVMVYTGLLTIAPGWWLFTTGFSKMVGYRKVYFKRGLPMLVAINAMLWIALITNPWHHQFIEMRPFMRSEYGPLWYVTAAVNYFALLAAVFVHASEGYVAQDPTIRAQCRFLVAAVAVPMSMNMIYVFSPVALPYDPTALGYAFSCVLFLFAVERRDLFVLERVSLPGVLDHDADPIIIITRHHQILYANVNARELFGRGILSPGAPIDDILQSAVPTFSIGQISKDHSDLREHHFTSPAGVKSIVAIEVSTVEKSRGHEAGKCLRLRDRTALRAALDESEEHFALLEALDLAMGEGLLFKDRKGDISYLNEAFARLWGMSAREMFVFGKKLHEHLEEKLRKPQPKAMREMWLPGSGEFESEKTEMCDLFLSDGRILEAITLPVKTEGGAQGRAWRMADVTKNRQESQAMIQAQKLEGLGLLAGGIAHDFNNLLMTVLGNTEIVRKNIGDTSPMQSTLGDIEAAATNAAELTGQLLAYAGETTYMTEALNLSSLISEVSGLISVTIPKSIEIDAQLTDDLPLVRGGSAQIRQVLMNLITNAVDAIGDEPGKIKISTGVGFPGTRSDGCACVQHGKVAGKVVHVAVSDNGAGMAAETLSKIFDPFFTTKFTGRGLGLAATRGILDSHEGQLRIETEEGMGTTFTFLLPAESEAICFDKKREIPDSPGDFSNSDVLVVDDEEGIRSILEKHLVAAGFNVHLASSGQEALNSLDRIGSTLCLVILDITMPGLSGVQTWGKIRENYSELPIIMSSGHPEEALYKLEGWNTEYDSFIQKPYRRKSLIASIEMLLQPGRATLVS